MTDALLSGLLAGYGVAIPVGAIGVLIMGLAARTSLAVGAGAGLGVATADGLYALLAVACGTAIAGLIRPAAAPLRWTALVVLVGLAARTAWSAWRTHRDALAARPARIALSTPGRAYAGLLGLTLLNPTTVVYFSALVLGRQAVSGDRSVPAGVLFVAAAFAASASWQLLVAAGGSVLGRALAGARGRLATALVSSAVMVVLAVRLAVTG
ncbi:LysE family transporter [Rugosimonospora acidiphila]|uniref:LysE family transporter n=1 Tax=Rugosimonospora acidiphila TaxID=556531 RepID=A0ABP9S5U8_9ACTN